MRIAIAAAVLTLVWCGSASAQTCTGAPSFRSQPYQAAIGTAFTDGARAVRGTIAAGGQTLFGGGGVGAVHFTGADANSITVAAFAGADLPASRSGRVFVCPLGEFELGSGPDIDPIDVWTVAVQGGGSVGVIVSQSATLSVVPSFGLAAVYQKISADFGGNEQSESDTSGVANVGVGFIFGSVGITPGVSFPFAAGGADPIFTIRLAIQFGR